jgi:hypothetical protein
MVVPPVIGAAPERANAPVTVLGGRAFGSYADWRRYFWIFSSIFFIWVAAYAPTATPIATTTKKARTRVLKTAAGMFAVIGECHLRIARDNAC